MYPHREHRSAGEPLKGSALRRDPRPMLVGERVARFRDPLVAHQPLAPFPAYLTQPVAIMPLASDFRFRPSFAFEPVLLDPAERERLRRAGIPVRRASVQLDFPRGTSFYATGEQCGSLLRNGSVKTLWTTDCAGYDDRNPSLYQAHPFVLAVLPDGSGVGIICETTWRCQIDLRPALDDRGSQRVVFRVDGPSPGVTVIERTNAMEVVRVLSELTGRMPMPPRWALGYHQCRWSYEPEERVRELAAEFRARRMPCDVIWLDIDYMNAFRCFTFDSEKFPDPAGLNADLHAQGFKTVWMIDPGLKVDPDYAPYAEGHRQKLFVRDASGSEFHGNVWPGACAFPDFTNARVRAWWAGLYRDFVATGLDGVWNDMNEPAVFDVPQKAMPVDNQHNPDAELRASGDLRPAPHQSMRNVYGMLMIRATREGVHAAAPAKRPFVLTRSNFLGGQRYAATWTGDNTSDWRHLRWSIPMALNLGLSGQPFVGPDIGGFCEEATPELFARWMGIGALLPFARGHTVKENRGKWCPDHEPWSFGEACERVCRAALLRRYRMLPYLYTLAWRSSQDGIPIVRPVWTLDPRNPRLRTIDDCFLLGHDVLVRCSVDPIASQRSPAPAELLPGQAWRRFEPLHVPGGGPLMDELQALLGDWLAGETLRELPELYLRAGSAVPLGPAAQHADEPCDVVTFVAVPAIDPSLPMVGELYEDANEGWDFLEGGYRLTRAMTTPDGALTLDHIAGVMPEPTRRVVAHVLSSGIGR
ncbi:MAG: glycoside hydrolase family 31 protein [Planctomycetota bacterium]|nr:glycoside hydrolase family 31 protein [Planctomycetota bacterium]